MYKNNGAPKNEVITPTGKIIGENKVLATVSEISNINDPKRAELGIKNL